MFLLILMLQALAIFAVDMNHRCDQRVESLLDCSKIDADNYQYSDSRENAIRRVIFLRLPDTSNVELKNLKLVDTVIVQRREAKCDQLKKLTGTVVIQLSDKSIVCDHIVASTSAPAIAAITTAVESTQLLQDVTTADHYTTKPQNQYLSTSSLNFSPNPPLTSLNPPASANKVTFVVIIIIINAIILTTVISVYIFITDFYHNFLHWLQYGFHDNGEQAPLQARERIEPETRERRYPLRGRKQPNILTYTH